MEPTLAPAAGQYGVSAYFVTASLDGLNEQDLYRAPENLNPMIWLFGHLTNTRCGLLNMLGRETAQPWKDLFGRGVTLAEPSAYPPLADIRQSWDAATAALNECFESISAAELAQPSPREFPGPDKSLLGAVNFLALHEGYHGGQMGSLRKWLGYGQLVG